MDFTCLGNFIRHTFCCISECTRVCHSYVSYAQGEHSIVKNTGGWLDSLQTCQVSMLRMSEKFVDPPENVSSVGRKFFGGPSRGSGGMLPRKKIGKLCILDWLKLHFAAYLLLKLSVI